MLDGELDVLNVFEVLLKNGAHFEEFRIGLRHLFLELEHWLWSAHAGNNVFTLSIDEELTVEFIDTVGWITGESHTGTRVVARVTIDHGLHVNGGTPLSRNVVFAAINDRAVVHP